MLTELTGVVLALGSALCFAGNRSVLSKPLLRFSPSVVSFFSVFIGLLMLGVAVVVSGELYSLQLLTLAVFAIFAAVGILHFGIGRQLSYVSTRNIGANLSGPLTALFQVLDAIILSIILLQERLSPIVGIGAALVVSGALMLEGRRAAIKREGNRRTGYLMAFSTGLIYGFTPVLISYGLSIFHYFVAALFVAYTVSFIFYLITLNPKKLSSFISSTPRNILAWISLSGVFAVSAQLFRFGALSFSSVIIVVPILTSSSLFTPLLTLRLAKNYEIFNSRTIVGIVIGSIGLIILAYYSGIVAS